MSVVLASTQHDPEGRLYEQAQRTLPVLTKLFCGLAFQVTHATQERSLALLTDAGALIQREPVTRHDSGLHSIGHARRAVLELALRLDAPSILFGDFDRVMHWVEYYPDELAQVLARISTYDFTVLGRTERAFASHPRIQRDTESIINRVYAGVSGKAWDATAAARGISRSAAAAILAGCPDESIGTDVSWPLFIQRAGGFTLGYIATEGLEFETADRYSDQIAAAGGLEAWMAQLDADPKQWAQRLHLAQVEVEATVPYLYREPENREPRTEEPRTTNNLQSD